MSRSIRKNPIIGICKNTVLEKWYKRKCNKKFRRLNKILVIMKI